MKERLYSITDLAERFDISTRTIRYYEEVGLLTSVDRDTPNHPRFYTQRERRRLKLILRGKRLGFSLQDIKEMVDLYEMNPKGVIEKESILQFTDERLKEIEEKIDQLEMLKADLLLHRDRFLKEVIPDSEAIDTVRKGGEQS